MLFFGLTFVLYGLAVRRGERYLRRLGWVAVGAGLGMVAVGFVHAVTGPSWVTLFVFPVLAAALSLWLLVLGLLLWRQTPAAARELR